MNEKHLIIKALHQNFFGLFYCFSYYFSYGFFRMEKYRLQN